MSPTHLGLHHLTEDQIDDLADLLYMAPRHMYGDGQPRKSWLKHQEKKMKRTSFPKRLRRPKGALNWLRLRVAEKTGWTHDEMLPQVADLCKVHQQGLNPWLIHDIFNLLHDESTLRTTRIRNHKSDLRTAEVEDFVTRLSGLTSLWLSPKKFENLFARGGVFPDWARFRQLGNAVEHPYEDADDSDDCASPSATEPVSHDKDEKPRRRRSCEACILSVVGGRPDLITALRANLLGRSKSKDHQPILILLIDAWVALGKANKENGNIEADSLALNRTLRDIRVAEGKVQKAIRDRRAARVAEEKRTEKEKRDRERGSRSSHHHSHKSDKRDKPASDKPTSHHSGRPATVDTARRATPVPPAQASPRGKSIRTLADLQEWTAATYGNTVETGGERDHRSRRSSTLVNEPAMGMGLSSQFSELGFNDDHYTEIGVQVKQQRHHARSGGRPLKEMPVPAPAAVARPPPSSVYSQDDTNDDTSTLRARSNAAESIQRSSFRASSHHQSSSRDRPQMSERSPDTAYMARGRAVTAWYDLMSRAAGKREVNEDGVSALDEMEEFPGYSEMLVSDFAPSENGNDDDADDGDEFRGARSAWEDEEPQQQQQPPGAAAASPAPQPDILPPTRHSTTTARLAADSLFPSHIYSGNAGSNESWVSVSVYSDATHATRDTTAISRPQRKPAAKAPAFPSIPEQQVASAPNNDDGSDGESYHSDRSQRKRQRQRERAQRKLEGKREESSSGSSSSHRPRDDRPRSMHVMGRPSASESRSATNHHHNHRHSHSHSHYSAPPPASNASAASNGSVLDYYLNSTLSSSRHGRDGTTTPSTSRSRREGRE